MEICTMLLLQIVNVVDSITICELVTNKFNNRFLRVVAATSLEPRQLSNRIRNGKLIGIVEDSCGSWIVSLIGRPSFTSLLQCFHVEFVQSKKRRSRGNVSWAKRKKRKGKNGDRKRVTESLRNVSWGFGIAVKRCLNLVVDRSRRKQKYIPFLSPSSQSNRRHSDLLCSSKSSKMSLMILRSEDLRIELKGQFDSNYY